MALRIAVFGQAAFGRDVLRGLRAAGHEVVGVYGPPPGARPDPLCEEAEAHGLRLFRHARFRRKGSALPERVEEWSKLRADLNVLAYVTVILPAEIVEAPPRGSLCFHPSLLPRYRGGAAIPWQIILGERETGVTIFVPDAGVDTGPIVLQRGGVAISATDNAARLYYDKLYPLGVQAMLDAVEGVSAGTLALRPQEEALASFQGLVDDEVARIDWSRPAAELDRLVRGCDPRPGAHALLGDARLRLFDSRLLAETGAEAPGTLVRVDAEGAVVAAAGGRLVVGRVQRGEGPKQPALQAGLASGERLR